jgi:taurine dioxygenase
MLPVWAADADTSEVRHVDRQSNKQVRPREGNLKMSYETIGVTKLTPHIGAEIGGVDLAKPLGNQQFQEIHDALMENKVIFFRDQKLTVEQHKAFGRLFGDLHVHPASQGAAKDAAISSTEGHPEILVVHADENSKRVAGEAWHSDVTCDEAPPMGSLLYMHEVPAAGGDTLFANMYTAYETLSEPIKRMLVGMTAVHDGEQIYRGRYGYDDRGKTYPRAEHPVVRTHPVTGRPLLFINSNFTTHIKGLKKNESDALLQMLYRHIETPEFHCRFRWQPGSLAFWDNRCTQHRALFDYHPQRRHAHRVTVKGDRTFYRA